MAVRYILEKYERVSADYDAAKLMHTTTDPAEVEEMLRRAGDMDGWRVIGAHLEPEAPAPPIEGDGQ